MTTIIPVIENAMWREAVAQIAIRRIVDTGMLFPKSATAAHVDLRLPSRDVQAVLNRIEPADLHAVMEQTPLKRRVGPSRKTATHHA